MSKGFTLIELILYTVLVGLVLGTVVLALENVRTLSAKTQATLSLEEGMRYAMARIKYRVQSANTITLPAAGDGQTLTLDMPAGPANPTTFALSAGAITIQENGGAAVAITGTHIEITDLTFTRLVATPAAVRIHLDGRLRNAVGASQITFHLDDTAVVNRR